MIGLPLNTWLRFVMWLVIGFVIYGCYGAGHGWLAKDSAAGASGSRSSTA